MSTSSSDSNSSVESRRIKRPRLLEETTIGKYRVLKTIGKGHFGKVMLAVHVSRGEKVAIKKINKITLSASEIKKLFKEAAIMNKLNHPNIVKLKAVIDTKHSFYMVMEYVSGGDLYSYLQNNGSLSEDKARAVFRQILSALEYCHQKGIVHRDIKDDNILIDRDMNIKIADFGLSAILAPGNQLQTFCGTVECMAPEIILGKKYGPEVDVWSLGTLLYIMLTSSSPFSAPTTDQIKKRVLRCCYDVPYFVSANCERLIMSILVLNPSKRPSLNSIMQDSWVNDECEFELQPYKEPEENSTEED